MAKGRQKKKKKKKERAHTGKLVRGGRVSPRQTALVVVNDEVVVFPEKAERIECYAASETH